MIPIGLLHRFRCNNLGLVIQPCQPAEELGADDDALADLEVLAIRLRQHGILSEAIQHHAHQRIGKLQLYNLLLAAEHGKELLGLDSHILAAKQLRALPPLTSQRNFCHFICAEMLQDASLTIVADEVIILIVPGQRSGADLIGLPAAPVAALFGKGIRKIAEGDLAVLGDGAVNGIHTVIDALVHAFDASGQIDLPLK